MGDIRVLFAARPTLHRTEQELALQQAGFDVILVNDGLRCLDMLYKIVPDVLVVECELPWGGGDGVLAEVQQDPVWHQVAVLVLKPQADSECMWSKTQFPVCDVVTNSLPPDQLAERVLRLARQLKQNTLAHATV